MTYPHQPENIKVCPQCGTNLNHTARSCAACGYRFLEAEIDLPQEENSPHIPPNPRSHWYTRTITLRLPALLGLILLLLAVNTLVVLGLQKRDQTKDLVAADRATGTYIATTFVSPTPSLTITPTPGPPTETPIVDIEYEVVSGDSCLSIVQRFNISLNSLLMKNDIDCDLLKIGTVLTIPHPTATPKPISTTAP